ncbi:3-dehydroquinate synthase family protein [Treponema sp.]
MNTASFDFTFGTFKSSVTVARPLPSLKEMGEGDDSKSIIICDTNTLPIAKKLISANSAEIAPYILVLESGEQSKNWQAVEKITKAALAEGISRDSRFIGVGGGVLTDLASFAAAIYMRGARLSLVPTTLLGMVDAALGGKTGFDQDGVKNLIGAFRPADYIGIGTDCLETLPKKEWHSGLAEVIKTAILGDQDLLTLIEKNQKKLVAGPKEAVDLIPEMVSRCVAVKGRIVEADPLEIGTERALLNLGHTFGHALESAAGLGTLTHGEAVAWGIARAYKLALALGAIEKEEAERNIELLRAFRYVVNAPHPAARSEDIFEAMASDKKKKAGALRFVIPTTEGATLVHAESKLIKTLLQGDTF